MLDPNTPGNIRSRYIGQWLFYIGITAMVVSAALYLADVYQFISWDEAFANVATYISYTLFVAGAITTLIGYLFIRS